MTKIWENAKSIIRGFSTSFGQYELLISLQCTVDSEWNYAIIKFVVSCLAVESFKSQKIQYLMACHHNSAFDNFRNQNMLMLWCLEHFASGWKKRQTTSAMKHLNLVLEPMPAAIHHTINTHLNGRMSPNTRPGLNVCTWLMLANTYKVQQQVQWENINSSLTTHTPMVH